MAKIAIIETGSKQYVVKDGDVIYVEKIKGTKGAGSKINFDKVLLTDDGKESKVGAPYVSGVKISGELIEEGRDKKVTVLRYREKSRSQTKKGHRQHYAKVKISL